MSQPVAVATQDTTQETGYAPMTRRERDLLDIDTSDRFADFGILADRGGMDAADWMDQHRAQVLDRVASRGWCVVRGLDLLDTASFRNCVARLGLPLVDDYGDLPMLPSGEG